MSKHFPLILQIGFVVAFLGWLLWNSELLLGLALLLCALYGALQLLLRFAEWYTSDYGGVQGSAAAPNPGFPESAPVSAPNHSDLYGPSIDEGPSSSEWEFDDEGERERQADRDRGDYYSGWDWDEEGSYGCDADYELDYEDSQLDALDGVPEGMGPGEDEDGRW